MHTKLPYRPNCAAVAPNGSLFVSNDGAGVVYRISFAKQKIRNRHQKFLNGEQSQLRSATRRSCG